MSEFTSSVSPKGQVTLPQEFRERLGIKPRDRVVLQLEGDSIRVVPAKSRLDAIYASIPPLPQQLSPEDMIKIATEEHARHVATEGL